MRESDLYTALLDIAKHPITFGIGAGVARFLLGDRAAGWKALVVNIILSGFVALMAMFYLMDEPYTDGKKAFFIVVASFLARDLLVALASLGVAFGKDPLGLVGRLRQAFKGGDGK